MNGAPIAATRQRIGRWPVRILSAGPRQGDRPSIVLVHGLGLSADVWRYHLRRLGDAGHRVFAPDTPGFGKSPGPAFGLTVEHAASWLARFADALGLAQAVWVGHSVSAQYVLRLAAVRPDLTAGLLLAAPTGEPGRLRWLRQLVGLARTAVREERPLVRDVAAHYLTTPPTRTAGAWLGARRHLALDDATAVRCPVHIVLGSRDPVVPQEFGEELVAHLANAELITITGSAHGVALAPAEPFCRTVLDLARQVFHSGPWRSGPHPWTSPGKGSR